MADQNESNKSGTNMIADDIDRSSTLTELERIGARAARKSIQRTQLEDRIKSEGKLLNSLIDEGKKTPEFRNAPFYQEQTTALKESIRGIRGRMNGIDNAAEKRAESETSTFIGRQFSPTAINSQVSTMQKESSVQNRAFSMSGKTYDQLEENRQEVLADIRVRERKAQNEVKGMFADSGQVNPEKSAAIGVMMSGSQEQFKQLATINAAQAYQRATGQDPTSKMKGLADMGQEANSILSADSVAKEVRAGGVEISQGGQVGTVKNTDINQELINQARLLSQALKGLAEGAGKTDEELAKLRETADESSSNMKKLQEAQKASGSNGFNGVNLANGIAGGFNAIGGAASQILVQQRMQETQNAGGFANLANQQYDMYSKARGGDVASQMALSQFGEADQFGMEMKRGTNITQSAYMVAGAAQTAAGGLQAANAAKNMGVTLGLTGSQEFMSGAQNAVQGLSTTAVTASDMARGTSAQAARLAGIQSNMQARQAVNYVGAKQAQGLRDFYTDLDVAGQEMGGKSSAFIQNSIGDDNMKKMQEARLSPQQFAKMSAFGAANMGSTFDSDQIYASRNLESRGFGSMQTNMQRMSQLASAGANNPKEGMESVLSAAVSKGLDSSKAISMMVDNTASMVSGAGASTAAGIDTVGSSSALLAGAVDPNQKNKEFGIQRAATALEVAKSVTTDTSSSFTGMVNTARVSKSTGLGGTDALFAAQLTTADLKSLQGMDDKSAKEALLKKGVNLGNKDSGTFLQTMLQNQTEQMFTGSGALAFGTNEERNSLAKKAKAGKSWKDLTTEEKSVVGKMGMSSNITGEEYFNTAAGIKNVPNTSGAAGKELTEGKGPDDIKKQMDQLRTSGFKQLAEAATFASDNLKQFGGALKVFTDLQQKFEKGGMANEKEFSTAGSEFAKSFTASTGMFEKSVSDFDKAVQKLSNNAGLKSNANPVMPQVLTDSMDKLRSGSRVKTH